MVDGYYYSVDAMLYNANRGKGPVRHPKDFLPLVNDMYGKSTNSKLPTKDDIDKIIRRYGG